jgi:hypothetical protein
MIIISGIPPVLAIGAGRFMAQVEQEARQIGPAIQLCYAGNKSAAADYFRQRQWGLFVGAGLIHFLRRLQRTQMLWDRAVMDEPAVILVHFQEIGTRWCLNLIQRRRHPTWIYLLDSSFFCVRSYNHVAGESAACLRCVGGQFTEGQRLGCQSFPIPDRHCWEHLTELRRLAQAGQVRFLAQTAGQAALVRRHFGAAVVVKEVGVWTVDLDEIGQPATIVTSSSGNAYDVVFHGTGESAKGVEWALEVARQCPKLRFLFPMDGKRFSRWSSCRHIEFQPMTWETGLKQHVIAARFVLVPSLWSAPIEGALVKSLCLARNVVVVDVPTAFSAELPAGLVLKLPPDPDRAAAELLAAGQRGVSIPESIRGPWREQFVRTQRGIVNRLLNAARA